MTLVERQQLREQAINQSEELCNLMSSQFDCAVEDLGPIPVEDGSETNSLDEAFLNSIANLEHLPKL